MKVYILFFLLVVIHHSLSHNERRKVRKNLKVGMRKKTKAFDKCIIVDDLVEQFKVEISPLGNIGNNYERKGHMKKCDDKAEADTFAGIDKNKETYHIHLFDIHTEDVHENKQEFTLSMNIQVNAFFKRNFIPSYIDWFDIKSCCISLENKLNECKKMIYALIDYRFFQTYEMLKIAYAAAIFNKKHNINKNLKVSQSEINSVLGRVKTICGGKYKNFECLYEGYTLMHGEENLDQKYTLSTFYFGSVTPTSDFDLTVIANLGNFVENLKFENDIVHNFNTYMTEFALKNLNDFKNDHRIKGRYWNDNEDIEHLSGCESSGTCFDTNAYYNGYVDPNLMELTGLDGKEIIDPNPIKNKIAIKSLKSKENILSIISKNIALGMLVFYEMEIEAFKISHEFNCHLEFEKKILPKIQKELNAYILAWEYRSNKDMAAFVGSVNTNLNHYIEIINMNREINKEEHVSKDQFNNFIYTYITKKVLFEYINTSQENTNQVLDNFLELYGVIGASHIFANEAYINAGSIEWQKFNGPDKKLKCSKHLEAAIMVLGFASLHFLEGYGKYKADTLIKYGKYIERFFAIMGPNKCSNDFTCEDVLLQTLFDNEVNTSFQKFEPTIATLKTFSASIIKAKGDKKLNSYKLFQKALELESKLNPLEGYINNPTKIIFKISKEFLKILANIVIGKFDFNSNKPEDILEMQEDNPEDSKFLDFNENDCLLKEEVKIHKQKNKIRRIHHKNRKNRFRKYSENLKKI